MSKHAIIFAAALLGLAVAGSTPAAEPTKIRFVTDWKAQAPQGGFYQAKALGLYAEQGLDVEIIQGGPSVNVPLLLGSNEVDFGIGSNSFIPLNMVAAGIPATAVAAIFQKDPQVLITHPREDIRSIADMKGKPIMISDAGVGSHWIWLKAKFGFTDRQIRKYTYNLAPFLADPRAIQQGYVTSEPYEIEKASGITPQVFLMADEDYPSYGTLILASDRRIQANPQQVRAFVAASIAGWKDYLTGDPTPGNSLIKADNPEMTDAVLLHAIAEMNRYRLATAGDAETAGIGVMTEARWQAFFETMSADGVYPTTLDWRRAFSLDFLPPKP
ncbi:ABC transporter substrate-binding protein [Thiocapsa roseopersicina]|uniref:NitT/TauT family transport system substrate-binding protein n=1 Tax=Thiocapsa roseopersicina TaxID=1058 RepID=A0A1H2SSM2_THIRO|nr:ABC transporter substrate-binding protein [Thiocapsa roseopersicina]SDW34661.1 NitT/TauT family transport system substrate-binding protein [Thiocapsa roseopersicina]